MTKEYKCICGESFLSSRSLGSHKNWCKDWILFKDGNLDRLEHRKPMKAGYTIKKEICPVCKKLISINNLKKHIKSHENNNSKKNDSSYHLDHEDLFCKFCGKQCKNKNSLVQHEIRCNNNPNKINIIIPNFNTKGKKAWNKGLTKDTDERVYNLSLQTSLSIKNYNNKIRLEGKIPGIASTPEKELARRQKISNTAKERKLSGGKRHGSGRGHKGWYKGIFCDSTYELAYVIYNLDHNIQFKRCTRIYEYEYNGEIHKYHPDFELEDGTLIEIKGYITDKVYAKISAVKDRNIKLLTKDDLKYAFDYINNTYTCKNLEDLYKDK